MRRSCRASWRSAISTKTNWRFRKAPNNSAAWRRSTFHPNLASSIAAGSTGSMPSTAKFLEVIAKLRHGAVVLPGLDTDLDDAAWQTIGGVRDAKGAFTTPPASNHPQYAMHALLSRFGIKRRDVDI